MKNSIGIKAAFDLLMLGSYIRNWQANTLKSHNKNIVLILNSRFLIERKLALEEDTNPITKNGIEK